MTKPDVNEIALRMEQYAEALDNTEFVKHDEFVTIDLGLQRAKRNPTRDKLTKALITAMRDCTALVDNAYLRSVLHNRTSALENALAQLTDENPFADKTASYELIRTAKFYAPMIQAITTPRTDGTEERARIIKALNESAEAVETGAEAYAYTIFDNSEIALAWQAAAQKLVDAMRAAVPYIPDWAANVGMNANALRVSPFVQTVRSFRSYVGKGGAERLLIEDSKRYADKARKLSEILA